MKKAKNHDNHLFSINFICSNFLHSINTKHQKSAKKSYSSVEIDGDAVGAVDAVDELT